jgi:hypothetical protein
LCSAKGNDDQIRLYSRASIAATHQLNDCQRTSAISAIDDAMTNLDQDQDTQDIRPCLM